jgi:uncharacterized protein (TIGR00730 family)
MADEVKTSAETVGETHEKAHALTRAIEVGKHEVPDAPSPLICKPRRIESWRIFKIMSEFVDGFDIIGRYGLTATFFGSTRTQPENPVFIAAADLSNRLAKAGFAVVTGGSSGIMQAGNKGAFEAGGVSIGLNIRLADNQPMNQYVTQQMFFDHFFVRKVMLTYASEVYVYFPGGFGTLDEFFEIVTLIQTKKIKRLPIVLYSKAFWDPIIAMFRAHLLEGYHTIDEDDLGLFVVVDTVDEAFDYITKNVVC